MAKNLGQYSVVSYVHELRGERINLGVLVWHPLAGCVFRPPKSLSRVRSIDESADLERVRASIERISETAEGWARGKESPLHHLACQFKHRLVVSPPMNARIQDPGAALERLSATLMPPEASFVRAPSTKQWASAFARHLEATAKNQGARRFRSNYAEEATFEPIPITASFDLVNKSYLWRAFSFASENDSKKQLRLAKAIYAENVELKDLKKHSTAHLVVAVQLPKPRARVDWSKAVKWLERASEGVATFEDRHSLDKKVPQLLRESESPRLLQEA